MGEVRAGDIDVPANVELVNPDLVLATLDSDDAQFEMELTVERGRGYVSFDAREGLPIGSIPVDATFSPIPKVNYLVETADFDLLTSAYDPEDGTPELAPEDVEGKEQVLIEIWSDGTIDPGEALSLAAQYLSQHSSLIANFNKVVAAPAGRELPGIDIPAHLFEMSIEDLSLSMRTYNCLKRSGVTKVGQILRMDKKELLGLRNFGEKSFDELYDVLSTRDLIPAGTPLDLSAGEPSSNGDGEAGEGDVEGEDGADMEIGYGDMTDDASEPAVYMAEPSMSADEQGLQVVDELGVSEGSAAMAAGIFIEDEPASEVDVVDSPDMVEAGNVEAEAKPKKSSKK
jgi:hypothetical protein